MNIQAISQRTGMSAHTLRYYEKINLLLHIQRDSKGHRDYSEKDVIWIEFIKRLKATNMPLEEIRLFAKLRSRGDVTINERLDILENHRLRVQRQLENLKQHLKKIEEKIQLCQKGGALQPFEKMA